MQTCSLCEFSFFAGVLFFGVSLSFRCAQTEILPISPFVLRFVIPWSSWLRHSHVLVASELQSSLRFQLALSTMMRSEHCASEGGI